MKIQFIYICRQALFQTMAMRFRNRNQNYNYAANFEYLEKQGYLVIKEIGRGSYGVVYKAEDKNTHCYCAIKINFNIITREHLYIEMGLLKLLRGKLRVPLLHRIIQKKNTYSIIMDYCISRPFITYFTTFNLTDVKHYLYQLLLGLKQLKEAGVYHRDIKPSNFLYDQTSLRGVIVDFGLAQVDNQFIKELQTRTFEDDQEQEYQQHQDKMKIYKNIQRCLQTVGINKIGTEIYMPPQSILRMENQSYQSDIWPVGIILIQFCSKRYNFLSNFTKMSEYYRTQKHSFLISYLLQLGAIFGKQRIQSACKDYFKCELTLPKSLAQIDIKSICTIQGFDDIVFDLLTQLLCLNPKERISVEKALEHPFFNGIREEHD